MKIRATFLTAGMAAASALGVVLAAALTASPGYAQVGSTAPRPEAPGPNIPGPDIPRPDINVPNLNVRDDIADIVPNFTPPNVKVPIVRGGGGRR